MQKQTPIINPPSLEEKEILYEIEEVAVKKIYDTKTELNRQYSNILKHEDNFYRQAYKQLEIVCSNQLQKLDDWKQNYIDSTNMTYDGTLEIIEHQKNAANEDAKQRILDYIAFKAQLLMDKFPEQAAYFKNIGWKSPIVIPETFKYPFRPETSSLTDECQNVMFPDYDVDNNTNIDFESRDVFEKKINIIFPNNNELGNGFQNNSSQFENGNDHEIADTIDTKDESKNELENDHHSINTELNKDESNSSFGNPNYFENPTNSADYSPFNDNPSLNQTEAIHQISPDKNEEKDHHLDASYLESSTSDHKPSNSEFSTNFENRDSTTNPIEPATDTSHFDDFNSNYHSESINNSDSSRNIFNPEQKSEPAGDYEPSNIHTPNINPESSHTSSSTNNFEPMNKIESTDIPDHLKDFGQTNISEPSHELEATNEFEPAKTSESESTFDKGNEEENKSKENPKNNDEEYHNIFENNNFETNPDQPEITAKFIIGQIKIGDTVALNLPEGLTLIGKIISFDSDLIKFVTEEDEEINIPLIQFEDPRYFFQSLH